MVEVNETLTRYVAGLARVSISEDEVKLFTSQLNQVLGYIEKLQELDVEGIEPMTHPLNLKAALREDQVVPFAVDPDGSSKVLASAPEVLYGGFKVPPIL